MEMASRTCNMHQIAQETDAQNEVRRKDVKETPKP